ncbi:hypothetical protein GGF32_001189 [Allomyces javanicus]|nr:hypothetical protein GGF32_001189 [Allomyces javanicus]
MLPAAITDAAPADAAQLRAMLARSRAAVAKQARQVVLDHAHSLLQSTTARAKDARAMADALVADTANGSDLAALEIARILQALEADLAQHAAALRADGHGRDVRVVMDNDDDEDDGNSDRASDSDHDLNDNDDDDLQAHPRRFPAWAASLSPAIRASLARDRVGHLLVSPSSPYTVTRDQNDAIPINELCAALGGNTTSGSYPWNATLMAAIGVIRLRSLRACVACDERWFTDRECCARWDPSTQGWELRRTFVVGLRLRGEGEGGADAVADLGDRPLLDVPRRRTDAREEVDEEIDEEEREDDGDDDDDVQVHAWAFTPVPPPIAARHVDQ